MNPVDHEPRSRFWDGVAVAMGLFIGFAGVAHFANPGFFNDIVPPWLPPGKSFWTYVSGVAEIIIAVMLLSSRSRRAGALAAIWLFVLVYPANLYMTWDWRDRPFGEQLVSWGRLPFQFVFIWLAWRIVRNRSHGVRMPGDVS